MTLTVCVALTLILYAKRELRIKPLEGDVTLDKNRSFTRDIYKQNKSRPDQKRCFHSLIGHQFV